MRKVIDRLIEIVPKSDVSEGCWKIMKGKIKASAKCKCDQREGKICELLEVMITNLKVHESNWKIGNPTTEIMTKF